MTVERPTRPTGAWTDHLRKAWRRRIGTRSARLDRAAHRVYFQWERFRLALRLMADPGSVWRYLRLESRWAPREPVGVRVRPLAGAEIWLRPGTTDAVVLRETFRHGAHQAPGPSDRTVRHIVDLGANVGITVAHNATLHPSARIVAVELDAGNAEMARRNCARFGARVVILQGAVWTSDGQVSYRPQRGNEHGLRVSDDAGGTTTEALSMDTIFSELSEDARVDYLKMDIEGVEASLLSGEAARWADRVDSIGLQVHEPYTLDECSRDLTALGFEPRLEPRRVNYIVAVRP
jgi:FkbM family methyltransferase